jgi:nucleotide-binding universal stress UspA family protein
MRATMQKSPFVYSTLDSRSAASALTRSDAPELAGRVLVVATDGSHEARAATAIASVIGRRHGAETVALRAYDYSAMSDRAEVVVAPWGKTYDVLDIARHLLKAELKRDIGEAETWNVRTVAGRPAHAIAAEARALDAALVIMGLRRTQRGLATPSHDTVMQVMRESTVPVLATTGALAGAPRRILVGVDFGLESVRLARVALALLDDQGELVLTHVQGAHQVGGGMRQRSSAVPDEWVMASLERVRRALPAGANVRLEVLRARDDVASSLLAATVRLHADCIAVGTQTRALDDGAKLGVVASMLVRFGLRSLLVVPSAPRRSARSATSYRN